MSGYLDDGSAGFHVLGHPGAIGVVQDPSEALAEGMLMSALNRAGADYVLPARDIGHKILELVNGSGKVVSTKESGKKDAEKPERTEVRPNEFVAYPDEGEGTPSAFACPECHGVLWEIQERGTVSLPHRSCLSGSDAR